VAAFWLLAIVLARRNLRRGQGDRRGAWRIALFVTVASACAWIPLSHHTSDPWDEFTSIFIGIGLSLLTAAGTWVGFVAIEPLVRRTWPRMLISLTRLIAGYFRDPMIGRDLLVGVTVGVLLTVLRALTALLPGGSPFQSVNLALSGVRYIFWFLGAGLVIAIYGPIFGATLLVGLQKLTRRLQVTCVVLVALLATVLLNDATGPLWARALFGVVASSVALAVVFRFGLVAYGATIFVFMFLRRMPVTLVPDDWYFGRSVFTLAIVIGLAVYGFVTSVGGKKWLPE
jgi:hypothetical protein